MMRRGVWQSIAMQILERALPGPLTFEWLEYAPRVTYRGVAQRRGVVKVTGPELPTRRLVIVVSKADGSDLTVNLGGVPSNPWRPDQH
jgi:hypothetical protein